VLNNLKVTSPVIKTETVCGLVVIFIALSVFFNAYEFGFDHVYKSNAECERRANAQHRMVGSSKSSFMVSSKCAFDAHF
jgi:hypothetical protein